MTDQQSPLEKLLEEVRPGETARWRDFLDRLAEITIGADATCNDLFTERQGQRERRRLAVILLRVLAVNDDLFVSDEFRVPTMALFDAELSDIYKILALTTKDQSFEKLRKLRDFAPDTEGELEAGLSVPSTVAGAGGYRHGAMKTVNSTQVKALILPFVDRDLIKGTFDGVLAAFEDYRIASSGTSSRSQLEHFRQVANSAHADLHRGISRYVDILDQTVAQLQELIEAHFAASPANRPASVSVTAASKKQPLHSPGTIDLHLIVSNEGPGVASEVTVELTSSDEILVGQSSSFLGNLEQGELSMRASAEIAGTVRDRILLGSVAWTDPDGTRRASDFIFEVEAQRDDIDWSILATADLYALEPVDSDGDLVGRREIIDGLEGLSEAESVGNAYVFGQNGSARPPSPRLFGLA